ncbi:hypothetical protein [uncultured Tateyamaria sp.]|uniref:hypothetical protein n=1 Tax=uncultured Tateyamaria sp. TaxID=455651 RepID=UPI00262D7F05|nr:hypothetical protein [uncultured Tateyamaria sp.]
MTYHIKAALLALATALPTHALADWSAAYAGFSFGSNITDEVPDEEGGVPENYEPGSSAAFGVFPGYTVQIDDFVFGDEFVFLITPDAGLESGGDELSLGFDVIDLKGHAGYAVNNVLFYGAAGVTRIYIAVESLARRAAGEASVVGDVGLDTLALRAAFKF